MSEACYHFYVSPGKEDLVMRQAKELLGKFTVIKKEWDNNWKSYYYVIVEADEAEVT